MDFLSPGDFDVSALALRLLYSLGDSLSKHSTCLAFVLGWKLELGIHARRMELAFYRPELQPLSMYGPPCNSSHSLTPVSSTERTTGLQAPGNTGPACSHTFRSHSEHIHLTSPMARPELRTITSLVTLSGFPVPLCSLAYSCTQSLVTVGTEGAEWGQLVEVVNGPRGEP